MSARLRVRRDLARTHRARPRRARTLRRASRSSHHRDSQLYLIHTLRKSPADVADRGPCRHARPSPRRASRVRVEGFQRLQDLSPLEPARRPTANAPPHRRRPQASSPPAASATCCLEALKALRIPSIGFEQHHERRGGEHQPERTHDQPESRVRKTPRVAPLHEQGNAHDDEQRTQCRRHADLHQAPNAAERGLRASALIFERGVRRSRAPVRVTGGFETMPGLCFGVDERVDALAQRTVLGARHVRSLRPIARSRERRSATARRSSS